jgi:hypothetical protein
MKKKSFIFHLDKSTDLRRDEDEDLDESQKNFYLQALSFWDCSQATSGHRERKQVARASDKLFTSARDPNNSQVGISRSRTITKNKSKLSKIKNNIVPL